MARAARTGDGQDGIEALLWSSPTGPAPQLPVATRAQVLPIGDLAWPDAEKLFLRLLHTVRPVQYAKLFGVPGQAQAGIDAYARLPLDLAGGTGGRDYITLQSRRVKTLTVTEIRKAVDDLLDGDWGDTTATFYFATSFDLQNSALDKEIRAQTQRLARLKITFVPWGRQEVSDLLKEHPRIVDDFFGRPWVEHFCGRDAADSLTHNLAYQDVRDLRVRLHHLYQSVFAAQRGVHTRDAADGEFVVLDVDPNRPRDSFIDADTPEPTADDQPLEESSFDEHTIVASQLGARRRSFRPARQVLQRKRHDLTGASGHVPADEWLASGKYQLLIGRPGAGKSSLLRFAAMDLLSSRPQSTALQREHAADLPIWLPFGFLCRHLEGSTERSLVSAAEAWLKSQSAADLWPLVQRALYDDRLLLLIDGVDEWSDPHAAEHALGILEAFLGRSQGSAILSTRPYAVERLNWSRPWARAEIAPLTDHQRRTITDQVLRPTTQPHGATPRVPSAWAAGVEPFLEQVEATPELAQLSRSPLFLTLLAATWQGEPLPRQRFRIYARLVDLLIEKHPQMRQRASLASKAVLSASEATILFAAVAYRLRLTAPAGTVTQREMRRLVIGSMTDDEILGYQIGDAQRIADEVLAMAEHEFGLIVSHGAGSCGFLHRVLLDHLAGQYLATLSPEAQAKAVQRFAHDPAWHDALLALLTAQVSPHTTDSLLSAALTACTSPWADIKGYELIAEALAAGVQLTPRRQSDYTDQLVTRIQSHPSLGHRANLVTSLIGALASNTVRTRLLPIMKRWFTAPRPNPAPSMWALRNLDILDDAATHYLLWGMRHPEDDTKINAALAIAHRFADQPAMRSHLVQFIEDGSSTATQAAAVLALGTGWATAPETNEWIDWARCQPSVPLRLVALHVINGNTSVGSPAIRAEERDWLLSLLRREDYRGAWPAAELVNTAATGD